MKLNLSRRKLLSSSMIVAMSQITSKAFADTQADESATNTSDARIDDFTYEVTRTEAEWKERLTNNEFRVMRKGATERRKSSPLWQETRAGIYSCKGCDLPVYDSQYKVILDKGWTFFKHCEDNSVLTKIDFIRGLGGVKTATEAHCRRCGSHLGHIYYIEGQVLHCINGASLIFAPAV